MKGDRLTPKQERFCLNLLKGMSQREAYIQAGYSGNQARDTIDNHAYQLAHRGE
ncbi:terminase small subunit, partial [Chloroflexota bacterium]